LTFLTSFHLSTAATYEIVPSISHVENLGKELYTDHEVTTKIRAPFDCGLGICPDDYFVKPVATLRIKTDILMTGSCGDIPLVSPDCPNNRDMNFGVTVGKNEYKVKGSPDWIELPVEVEVGGSNYKVSFTGPIRIDWVTAGIHSDTHYWGYRTDKSTSICEGVISKGNSMECNLKIYYSSYSTS
jgi:hypothetical protein